MSGSALPTHSLQPSIEEKKTKHIAIVELIYLGTLTTMMLVAKSGPDLVDPNSRLLSATLTANSRDNQEGTQ